MEGEAHQPNIFSSPKQTQPMDRHTARFLTHFLSTSDSILTHAHKGGPLKTSFPKVVTTHPGHAVRGEPSVFSGPVVAGRVEKTRDHDEDPDEEVDDVEDVVEADGTLHSVRQDPRHDQRDQTPQKIRVMFA